MKRVATKCATKSRAKKKKTTKIDEKKRQIHTQRESLDVVILDWTVAIHMSHLDDTKNSDRIEILSFFPDYCRWPKKIWYDNGMHPMQGDFEYHFITSSNQNYHFQFLCV